MYSLFVYTPVIYLNGQGDTDIPSAGLSVVQAYSIDSKIDDGLPQTGKVTAESLDSYTIVYSSGDIGSNTYGASGTVATASSSTTCFDNGNVGGTTQQYSMSVNGGNGINCGIMIKTGF